MTTIAFTEAKATLSDLLDRVEDGEEITITRHNQPVAKLVAAKRSSSHEMREVIEALKRSRSRSQKVTQAEIKEWKNAGRP
jgi:prevent-host-death family protein